VTGYRAMAEKISQAVCSNLAERPSRQTAGLNVKDACRSACVGIVLTSNRGIRKLNSKYRGKNSATDVLSFPISFEPPPLEMPWELGEIFISVEQAVAQAELLNHGLKREMAFLTTHGLLHLFGFDHMEPEQEKEMFARQKDILKKSGYPR
jgi:probable rRNA maturation factor